MQLIWFCLQLALTLHPINIYIINMVDGFALLATTLKNAKTAKSPSDFTVTWRYSTLKK